MYKPKNSAPKAEETLVFYFRTLYEATGLNWNEDNEQEIREAVENIVTDAVRTATEEAAHDARWRG